MKKMLFVFAIASGVSHYVVAQKQTNLNSVAQTNGTPVLTYEQKMITVRNCPELLNQLTKKFGKDFSLDDSKVIGLLQSNSSDMQVSPVIRKLSIYLLNHTKSN